MRRVVRSRFAPSPLVLGAIGATVLVLATAFVFLKKIPFTHGHRMQAVVKNSVGLRKGSPVRIAGVQVGKVTGFGRGEGSTAVVKMELEDAGRPVHRDATLRVRPRLFLEGGFYVDLSPGSPSAPELEENGRLPLTQTAVPVQFSDVLGVLDRSGRDDLRQIIGELDESFDDGGAQAVAAAQKPLADALRDGSIVAEAAQGREPGDLAGLVANAATVTKALAAKRADLGGLVDATAITMRALDAENANLRAGLSEIDAALTSTPGDLESISRALPTVNAALAEVRPGLRQARTSVPPLVRTLRELRLASGPDELRGLLADLRPTLATVPPLIDRLEDLLPRVTPVTDCVRDRVLPVLNAKLDDGNLSTDRPVWQELAHLFPGLAGAGGNFDANGNWVRFNVGVGEQTVSTGNIPGLGVLSAAVEEPIVGSRPTYLGPDAGTPPFNPNAACRDQAAPNLSARTSGSSAMRARPGVADVDPQVERRVERKASTRAGLTDLIQDLQDGFGR